MASELALEAQNEEVDVKQPPMTAQEMALHAHESLRTMAQRLQTTAAAAARSRPAASSRRRGEAARHCGDRARTALAKLLEETTKMGATPTLSQEASGGSRSRGTKPWSGGQKNDNVLNGDEAAYAAARLAESAAVATE